MKDKAVRAVIFLKDKHEEKRERERGKEGTEGKCSLKLLVL